MDEQPRSPAWEVRIAESRGDRDRVFRFRYESHIAEYGRWPTAGMPERKILREVADEGATLLFAEWENRIAAALRLQIGPIAPDLRAGLQASRFRPVAPAGLAVVDQIVTARALRRTTLLGDLLRAAELEARCRGVSILLCHARDDQAHFYTALGFQFYALGFPMIEYGTRYPLVKAVGGPESVDLLAQLLADTAKGGGEPRAASRL